MSVGDGDAVAGTLASGLPGLCSMGVGVKRTLLLVEEKPVGEESVLLLFLFEAGLVTASSLGSVELSWGS